MSQRVRSTPARIIGEVALASALLGGVLAVGWVALTPDVYAEVTEVGWFLSRAQERQRFGAEAWFGLLAVSVAALLDDHGPWHRAAIDGSAEPRDARRGRRREPDQVSW